jgi:hypothetical protein
MKTLKVGDRQVPFDDSNAVHAFVDMFTEDALIEGVIHLGFGSLITRTGDRHAEEVRGAAYLRMTPAMAERTIQALQKLVQVAKTPIPPTPGKGKGN